MKKLFFMLISAITLSCGLQGMDNFSSIPANEQFKSDLCNYLIALGTKEGNCSLSEKQEKILNNFSLYAPSANVKKLSLFIQTVIKATGDKTFFLIPINGIKKKLFSALDNLLCNQETVLSAFSQTDLTNMIAVLQILDIEDTKLKQTVENAINEEYATRIYELSQPDIKNIVNPLLPKKLYPNLKISLCCTGNTRRSRDLYSNNIYPENIPDQEITVPLTQDGINIFFNDLRNESYHTNKRRVLVSPDRQFLALKFGQNLSIYKTPSEKSDAPATDALPNNALFKQKYTSTETTKIICIEFTHDSKFLEVISLLENGSYVKDRINVETNETLQHHSWVPKENHSYEILQPEPGDTTLKFVSTKDSKIELYDRNSGKLIDLLKTKFKFESVKFTAKDEYALMETSSETTLPFVLYNLKSKKSILLTKSESLETDDTCPLLNCVACTIDLALIAVGYSNGCLSIYNAHTGKELAVYQPCDSGKIISLSFNPNNTALIFKYLCDGKEISQKIQLYSDEEVDRLTQNRNKLEELDAETLDLMLQEKKSKDKQEKQNEEFKLKQETWKKRLETVPEFSLWLKPRIPSVKNIQKDMSPQDKIQPVQKYSITATWTPVLLATACFTGLAGYLYWQSIST